VIQCSTNWKGAVEGSNSTHSTIDSEDDQRGRQRDVARVAGDDRLSPRASMMNRR
jgi:hypothetical protein